MARERLTWNKSASPPPALPVEEGGYEHPAAQPDPGADEYKSGDTSTWAEDPHPGPYENSAHPAIPDEGPSHPAQPAGKVASEEELEAIAQARAAKCIHIAQALLGQRYAYNEIEAQAYGFMHMPDSYIEHTLVRLASKAAEDEEEDEDEGKKEASVSINATLDRRLKTIERGVAALSKKAGINLAEWMDEEALLDEMMAEEEELVVDDDEALLDEMMAEEGMSSRGCNVGMDPDEALLDEMMQAEGMGMYASEDAQAEAMLREMMAAQKGAEDEEEEEIDETDTASSKEASLDVELGVTQNFDGIELTAGSMDTPVITENDAVLASLFEDDFSRFASDEEDEDEDEGKTAGLDDELMAALRPQTPKRASGATRIGQVTGTGRTAAQNKEAADLQNLWDAPPDVSEYFETGSF